MNRGLNDPSINYNLEDDESLDQSDGQDALDQFLESYQFKFEPELRLKFCKKLKNMSISIAACKPWKEPALKARLTFKPVENEGWLGKLMNKVLILPNDKEIYIATRKLRWKILTFQAVAGYNWEQRKPLLTYRLMTKWNEGGQIKRKERFQVLDNLALRCNWQLDLVLPDIEGHLGQETQYDMGSMNLEITQLDLCYHL